VIAPATADRVLQNASHGPPVDSGASVRARSRWRITEKPTCTTTHYPFVSNPLLSGEFDRIRSKAACSDPALSGIRAASGYPAVVIPEHNAVSFSIIR